MASANVLGAAIHNDSLNSQLPEMSLGPLDFVGILIAMAQEGNAMSPRELL